MANFHINQIFFTSQNSPSTSAYNASASYKNHLMGFLHLICIIYGAEKPLCASFPSSFISYFYVHLTHSHFFYHSYICIRMCVIMNYICIINGFTVGNTDNTIANVFTLSGYFGYFHFVKEIDWTFHFIRIFSLYQRIFSLLHACFVYFMCGAEVYILCINMKLC